MAALKQIDMAALKIPRTVQRHRGLPTLHILHSGLGLDTRVEGGARDNGRPIIAPKKQKA
jgi:hypothetical protein